MHAKSFLAEYPKLFGDRSRPWVLLGKGPSLARYEADKSAGQLVMGLNHVGAHIRVDLAHVVDIDVIEQCGELLLHNARYLVMPWIPHVRHQRTLLTPQRMMDASGITLDEWCERLPVLESFRREGRLHWYNLETAPGRFRRGDDPGLVAVSFFSATAAVDLLGRAGVRTIRTLGIDGGRTYDDRFNRLAKLTLLANGRSDFDLQFAGMARSIMEHGIDLGPADMELPVRVYVGAEPEQWLAVKVLEYSIRKHASVAVVVEPLHDALQARGLVVPLPHDPRLAPRTPFSYQRFAIPALKRYRGRAIYLDSDMLVFDDIRKLWAIPFDGAPLLSVEAPPGSGRRPQYSVALLDCEALTWDVAELVGQLDSGKWTYEEFMFEMKAAPGARVGIPARWNDLERYSKGDTALTHFTDMDQQPWLETVNPIAHVWCRELLDAISAGFISRADVEREVLAGHVRPSLLAQVDSGIADPLLMPKTMRSLDDTYLPSHVLAAHGAAAGGGHHQQLRWLRFRRKLRMRIWKVADRVGLWNGLKMVRNRMKVMRQEMRIASARRRHGFPRG